MKKIPAVLCVLFFGMVCLTSLSGVERKRSTSVTFYVAPGNKEVKTDQLRSFAEESGGYVSYFSGTMVKLRIPREKIEQLKEVLRQGAYILDQQVRHRDITLKLMDLKTRLETKKKLHDELSRLFAGSRFHQTIEIEREMGHVIVELERLRGEIGYYKELSSLVDVSIYLRGDQGRHFSIPQQFHWMRGLGVQEMIRRWDAK